MFQNPRKFLDNPAEFCKSIVPQGDFLFQVKGDAVSLNPRAGERAVLIKNNQGDWGIVTGKWTGFRKGIAGLAGK